MSTTTVPREQIGSGPYWALFFGFGLLLVVYGLYAMTLPLAQPDHWNEITTDPTVISYISPLFQWLGLLALGFGVFTMFASYAGFRPGERWAWILFWFYPIFFLLAVPFHWIGLGWSILLVVSVIALLGTYRRFFSKAA